MCYAKPGPRCSRHAREKLDRATENLTQLVRTHAPLDERTKAVERVLQAEEEYDATPAGLALLEQQIGTTTDPRKQGELQLRYNKGQRTRESQKQAHRERLEQESRANTPEVLFKHEYNVTYNSPSETSTIPASLMAECDYSSPTSPNPTEKGISVVYDYYGCAGTCGDDDMCRDGKYSGLRVEKFDSREYLAYRFGVGSEDITDEMVAALDEISPAYHIDLDVMGDYYGEQVTISAYDALDAKVQEIYRGIQGTQNS